MHRLCDLGLSISTAESCTGGMLAALLTDIEGAGHGFDRGFVTYTKEAKRDLLGIPEAVLDKNDAVSEKVARATARVTAWLRSVISGVRPSISCLARAS